MLQSISSRRSFAIISHPDAGKTTLTEKLLYNGGVIQIAGEVKARKSSRHATSDWMELEKQRGISVTTSVMQIPYREHFINLLDTPGHADFSEDTYRTLSAVDSALMVIDAAKGVEARTIKLMEVCRLRKTPIITFINKMDRDCLDGMTLLGEIENVLKIDCAPITWPIGMGKHFYGVYNLIDDSVTLYNKGQADIKVKNLDAPECAIIDTQTRDQFLEEVELVKNAGTAFNRDDYLNAKQTPVFFGTALNNFGVTDILDALVDYAPAPASRITKTRTVQPDEEKFSGFIFKIQANMDPQHHDRIAFMRIISGEYKKGIRLKQVRTGKTIAINDAVTFVAGSRENTDQASPGDIIGLHNHGTIRIGDTFTQGEELTFTGIPNFAPELFREVILDDPLKQKALLKGLQQLSEEGATQYFKPIHGNRLILGAIGVLQFDVVAHRLSHEYKVKCHYDSAPVNLARWIISDDKKELDSFTSQEARYIATDAENKLVYLAPSKYNLELTCERWPKIKFADILERA